MRKILDFNHEWSFIRAAENAEAVKLATGTQVKLPHTWNAEDGQDGGNDYHRGTCWYKKTFAGPERKSDERVWLEFGAVAMTANVYMNDRHLAHHEGGYSIFRVDITDTLEDDNVLVVSADNSKNETVYPQKADFTFYGGIYRDVKLIIVPAIHFSLDYNGSPAIKITPKVDGTTAEVKVETWVSGNVKAGSITKIEIETAGQKQTVPVENGYAAADFTISNVHLWDGLDDPYLYTARAKIVASGSEYGADANPQYQTAAPEKGDWTESYQAVYHEHLLKMWSTRPYIWAMHCWNMFDFGADGRNEGGKPGQNQKGLVTFDRKTRKDAFYIYKAYLSHEPFVHICGRRFVDRPQSETLVKVYSNLPAVTLMLDGRAFARIEGDKVFEFSVPISAEHTIEAVASVSSDNEEVRDQITIRRTAEANPDYRVSGGEVVNWFDKPEEVMREGYYSIMDTMGEIKQNTEAAAILAAVMAEARKSYGEVAKGVTVPESVQKMMDREPLNQVLKQARKAVTPSMIAELNHKLNQIKKD